MIKDKLQLIWDGYIIEWCDLCEAQIRCPECNRMSCSLGFCDRCQEAFLKFKKEKGNLELTQEEYLNKLKKDFIICLNDWRSSAEKQKYSSNSNDADNCNGFKHLVKMGIIIFPFILEELNKEINENTQSLRFSHLLRSIVGDKFGVPSNSDLAGRVNIIRDESKLWLNAFFLGCQYGEFFRKLGLLKAE